ncbi:MAG: zinc-ribbon domain-containing protein, partial [Actinomycetota bacterium]
MAVTRYCTSCGLDRREGERFCRNCGAPFGTAEARVLDPAGVGDRDEPTIPRAPASPAPG